MIPIRLVAQRGVGTFALVASLAFISPTRAPEYQAVPVSGSREAARIRAELGKPRYQAALKLNRLDARHASRAETLIVPEAGFELAEMSPWPARIDAGSHPKLLLVSLRIQAFAAYEHGRQVRWGPISSGGPGSPTPAGTYQANWRSRLRVSSEDDSWIMPWYVNIDERLGIAFHQHDLPGRPASHRCIRLMEDDARWVYDWVSLPQRRGKARTRGTPVLVVGQYDFHARRPWKNLPVDRHATIVQAKDLAGALRALAAKSSREKVGARRG